MQFKIRQPANIPPALPNTLLSHAKNRVASMEATRPQAPPVSLAPRLQAQPPAFTAEQQVTLDESQEAAIRLLMSHQYACMTGAAGTGKTTVTRRFVEELAASVSMLDKRVARSVLENVDVDTGDLGQELQDDEDKNTVQVRVPSIALCAFTGIAVQQIRKKFDRSWWPNIMTIHRLLEYKPFFEEVPDPENPGKTKIVKRFHPTRTAQNPLLYEVIIIDEAGMLGSDLWENLLAACLPTTRIYMIGDINQLQPVTGRGVFIYAMGKWPTAELTTVHRQKDSASLPILDAAHAVLAGKMPTFTGTMGKLDIPINAEQAAGKIRNALFSLREAEVYDPFRDGVITAINGFEPGKAGWLLGQQPLNDSLAHHFNKGATRIKMDAAHESRTFACGDRVMATVNDHEIGVVNGMLGQITQIARNGNYDGDPRLWGAADEIRNYISGMGSQIQDAAVKKPDYESLVNTAMTPENRDKRNDVYRGPSSHSVTVRFSNGVIAVHSTKSEIASLRLGYVFTCHKTQGSEFPFGFTIIHPSFGRMLSREWLYTALTRASQRALFAYVPAALASALRRQAFPGKTVKEKVAEIIKKTGGFAPKLPEPKEACRKAQ